MPHETAAVEAHSVYAMQPCHVTSCGLSASGCSPPSFSCFGPHIWNSLPQDLRHCSTLSSFKAKLKIFLFSQYFHPNISTQFLLQSVCVCVCVCVHAYARAHVCVCVCAHVCSAFLLLLLIFCFIFFVLNNTLCKLFW